MKSYTDLEQSRKLAEILPLESADMCYIEDKPNIGFLHEEYKEFGDTILQNYYPCWSLAALLNVFPPYLFEFKRGIDFNVYPNLNGKGWHCGYMPNNIENIKKDKFKLITSEDNLVDAAYNMILKLNELKML